MRATKGGRAASLLSARSLVVCVVVVCACALLLAQRFFDAAEEAAPKTAAAAAPAAGHRSSSSAEASLAQPLPRALNVSDMRSCITGDLHRQCYNRGSDTCRWATPNRCNYSGQAVSDAVFRGRTLLFRGDSTLRDIFSEFTGKCCTRQIALDGSTYGPALAALAASGAADDGYGIGSSPNPPSADALGEVAAVPSDGSPRKPRLVEKADTNWEARNLIVRTDAASPSDAGQEGRSSHGPRQQKATAPQATATPVVRAPLSPALTQRMLFHFDYNFHHLLEPPIPPPNQTGAAQGAGGGGGVEGPLQPGSPAAAAGAVPSYASTAADDLRLFHQRIVGTHRRVDVAVVSIGIYEARYFAQNNFTEPAMMAAITGTAANESTPAASAASAVLFQRMNIVDYIVQGVCDVANATAGIFYAPTLECRALRKSKGASAGRATWCSRASYLLRQMNLYIGQELAKRSGEGGGGRAPSDPTQPSVGAVGQQAEEKETSASAATKGTSRGAAPRTCPVYFIPAFLCYGNHWVCTNDGMHGRRTSHYVSSKTQILRQALRTIFTSS